MPTGSRSLLPEQPGGLQSAAGTRLHVIMCWVIKAVNLVQGRVKGFAFIVQ